MNATRVPVELVLIGGGEHARVVLDAARSRSDLWRPTAYVDPQAHPDIEALGPAWLGSDADAAPTLRGRACVIAVGVGRDNVLRQRIARELGGMGVTWVSVIHASAIVSAQAIVDSGAVVLAGAVVNPGAHIGDHAIVNSGAIVEHDVAIGAFVHVAPGAVVGGGASVGEGATIGLGARIRDHIRVGPEATVGMGAVVVGDVPDGVTVMGVPAKAVRSDRGPQSHFTGRAAIDA